MRPPTPRMWRQQIMMVRHRVEILAIEIREEAGFIGMSTDLTMALHWLDRAQARLDEVHRGKIDAQQQRKKKP